MRKNSGTVENDSGAGTILALAALALILGIFSGVSLLSLQLLENSRLQATTEAAALAAADALRGVSSGYPCIVAKDIVASSERVLDRCRIVGLEVFIETSLETFGIVHKAQARAGPG